MYALYKTGYSLRTGMFYGSCLIGKIPTRLTEIGLCRRNYKIPVTIYESEIKYKKKDNVPVDSEILYKVVKPKRFLTWAIIANSKIIATPVVLSIIYCERRGKFSFHSDYIFDLMAQSLMFLTETQCYGLGSIVAILAILMNRYVCLHPMRIYSEKNSNKFIAIYINSFLPWRYHKHEFSTVKRGFMGVLLDNKRAFIQEQYFITQAHQYKLWRYLNHPT